MSPQALVAVATLVSFAQHGNRVELRLDRGAAELVWVTPGAFHFRRTLDGPLPDSPTARSTDTVDFKLEDTPSALHVRSKLLDVALQKHGLLVQVSGPSGTPLMSDLTEPKPDGKKLTWDRQAPPGVRFFGLDRVDDPTFDLRGKTADSGMSMLYTSAGYGEQHAAATLDFTAPDRYRIQSPHVDYYFFYGPKPKDILKQRPPTITGNFDLYRLSATWNNLRVRLLETVHRALTFPGLPPVAFTAEDKATDELKTRIRQFASLSPTTPPFADLSAFRLQLASFFDIYSIETRDKHYPIWHALPFQFPDDPECALHADEFMLGDEMLVAPIYEPGNKRQIYFPPGTWTSLETNREYPGRQTAAIETPSLPVFAHKGAIVPLDSAGGIALHYFPDLGGEFFLLERDANQYTQIHAAPAADVMRLEIESKKDRDYEWVIHHVERPATVSFEDRQYKWSYDAERKNLQVRVSVKAGEDNVIHISW